MGRYERREAERKAEMARLVREAAQQESRTGRGYAFYGGRLMVMGFDLVLDYGFSRSQLEAAYVRLKQQLHQRHGFTPRHTSLYVEPQWTGRLLGNHNDLGLLVGVSRGLLREADSGNVRALCGPIELDGDHLELVVQSKHPVEGYCFFVRGHPMTAEGKEGMWVCDVQDPLALLDEEAAA